MVPGERLAQVVVPPARNAMPLKFSQFKALKLLHAIEVPPRDPATADDPLSLDQRPRSEFKLVYQGGEEQKGTTIGHHETDLGLFLFPPVSDTSDWVRCMFVPREVLVSFEVGERIGDLLVRQQVATQEQVDAAAGEQRDLRDRRVGDILVAQHMPAGFTHSFAQRLNGICRIAVSEAVHGERVLPGHAYIAPGGFHLSLTRSGANYVAQVDQEPPVNRHRPSVDVLFQSAAKWAGEDCIAVLLTGMGKDGAVGMAQLKRAGAITIAQDQASCVVFGMPKEAIALGVVDEVLPLGEIAKRVLYFARSGRRPRQALKSDPPQP